MLRAIKLSIEEKHIVNIGNAGASVSFIMTVLGVTMAAGKVECIWGATLWDRQNPSLSHTELFTLYNLWTKIEIKIKGTICRHSLQLCSTCWCASKQIVKNG